MKQANLFRKLNEVFFGVVCAGTRLKKGTNGEEGQEYFEDCATRVVLVGRLDVASDDMGSGYLIKNRLCLYESVGEKCEEGIEGGRAVYGGGHSVSCKVNVSKALALDRVGRALGRSQSQRRWPLQPPTDSRPSNSNNDVFRRPSYRSHPRPSTS